ncbi:MAG: SDR family oxidoreductase [Thermoleophilaceae bacterium]|nr:SDR family oxidoreductase [Thermoleophilaceae bacterium]
MGKEPRSIAGKAAAITGGARGIGAATAEALVREGTRVAIGDLDLERAEATAERLGGGTVALELDVTDRASFERFVDDAEAALGPLDVLVNNAGIMPIGRFTEEDDVTAERMVDINCHGVLYGMKIVVPRFEARGSGHLVNIASTAGKGGFPGGATYCGTKHFVVGVSEAVRAELRGTEVEVSCVMPGVVNTELAHGLVEGRGVEKVEPEDVAAEIVSALKQPRFDVFVPRSIGPITKVLNVLPRAGREAVARFLKADQILLEADQGARRGYEQRAARSEPGLEAQDQPVKTGV